MKKRVLTGAIAAGVAAIGFLGQVSPAEAASLGSCASNIGSLVPPGGIGQSGFVGADACEKSLLNNDSESDVETIFSDPAWTRAFKTNAPNANSDELFTQGDLALTYTTEKTGTWALSGLASDVTSFILAVKGGGVDGQNRGQAVLYYLFNDLTVLSGDWSTFGLLTPGRNGNQPDLSHITVYTLAGDPVTAVPTPALLPGLIGLGATALRKKKQTAKQEA
jgi:hypothetical protein